MFSLKFQFATPCTIGYHFKSLFMLHPLYLTVPTCTGSHVMSEKKNSRFIKMVVISNKKKKQVLLLSYTYTYKAKLKGNYTNR